MQPLSLVRVIFSPQERQAERNGGGRGWREVEIVIIVDTLKNERSHHYLKVEKKS